MKYFNILFASVVFLHLFNFSTAAQEDAALVTNDAERFIACLKANSTLERVYASELQLQCMNLAYRLCNISTSEPTCLRTLNDGLKAYIVNVKPLLPASIQGQWAEVRRYQRALTQLEAIFETDGDCGDKVDNELDRCVFIDLSSAFVELLFAANMADFPLP